MGHSWPEIMRQRCFAVLYVARNIDRAIQSRLRVDGGRGRRIPYNSVSLPSRSWRRVKVDTNQRIRPTIGASGRKIPIFIPFADARFGSLADMCGATSKTYRLLGHLVGAVKQCWRHDEAERIRGFEVDHQLILGRRLRWQVGRLLALRMRST